jgi:hypothetical protein
MKMKMMMSQLVHKHKKYKRIKKKRNRMILEFSEDKEDVREEEIREDSPRRDTKTPSRMTQKNHPEELIIGNKSDGVKTRRQLLYQTKITLLSHIEPNSIKAACKDENWVNAMNE